MNLKKIIIKLGGVVVDDLYGIIIGIILLMIAFYFVKKIVKFILFTIAPIFLSRSLEISYINTIIMMFLAVFIVKDLYKKIKLLLKCIFASQGKYYSCFLEKIVSILFEFNFVLFHFIMYSMLIHNVLQNTSITYLIENVIIIAVALFVLKVVRTFVYKILFKNKNRMFLSV